MQLMHLQLTKVRSGRSTKRYARLVQSYRRDDGMPAQKVLANLGELSDQEVQNFRVALEASPLCANMRETLIQERLG